MSQHVIGFAIGPVQEFIQAGRKTRDLWFGSFMLSEIARTAAEELRNHGKLIFPASSSLQAARPAPNKLLALLDDTSRPEKVAIAVRETTTRKVDQYRDDLIGAYGVHLDTHLTIQQVEEFLEFYAAWCPIPDSPTGNHRSAYAEARATVELLIAGRKASRDFLPAAEGTTSNRWPERSALDPSRLSVIREPLQDAGRRTLKLRGAERLDAVSLIKRTAAPPGGTADHAKPGDERFVSTARVAIDPFIRRLKAESDSRLDDLNRLAGQLNQVIAEGFATGGKLAPFRDFPWDIQAFWDPGISEIDLTGFDSRTKERHRQTAVDFHATAASAMRDHDGIAELPAYFAVVQADGDRMGRLINRLAEPGWHERFSYHSAEFSAAVGACASRFNGALVFSGGDDVLAFLPLDTAFAFTQAIQTAWSDAMRDLATDPILVNDHVDLDGVLPTLSAGVAIVHYSEHLQRALGWARDAEQAAKRAGRDRLAIAYYPRGSGSASAQSIRQWTDAGNWHTLINLHRANDLPDGAGYDLRELGMRFKGVPAATTGSLLGLERDRILLRKRGQHGQTPIPPNARTVLGVGTTVSRKELSRIADEIIISREFAKSQDTARTPFVRPDNDNPDEAEGAA